MVFDKTPFIVHLQSIELKYVNNGEKYLKRLEIIRNLKQFIEESSVLTYDDVYNELTRLTPITNKWVAKDMIYHKLWYDLNESRRHKRLEIKSALPKGAVLLGQFVVGSQSFGTATPTSDMDIKGIYIQPDIYHTLTNGYKPTSVVGKDETYFEIRQFLELIGRGESVAMEMLFSPERCITISTPELKFLLSKKDLFVTKKLYYSFYNYAIGQFRKATNYNKKANWSDERIRRKNISEFCMFMDRVSGKTIKFNKYLAKKNINPEDITMTKLDGFGNGFKVYNFKTRGWYTENSNEIRTGAIPKENSDDWLGSIYFNHHEYSEHCKEYREYQEWLTKRSNERYNTNKNHGQNYDAKNIMHTVRLIMTAMEIPRDKKVNVDRTKERDYLLSIKRGEVDLETELNKWLGISVDIKKDYDSSDLPEYVDPELINEIHKKIRLFHKFKKKGILS